MSEPTVQGVVHLVEETKTYGQKGFRKRLVVLEQDNGRFVNYIPVEFIQDSCDAADDLNVGDQVEITYRLSGRKWQRDPASEVKYFLSAEALRFQVVAAGSAPGEGRSSAGAAKDANAAFQEASDDEVPF
jgi:hypothetical protein